MLICVLCRLPINNPIAVIYTDTGATHPTCLQIAIEDAGEDELVLPSESTDDGLGDG